MTTMKFGLGLSVQHSPDDSQAGRFQEHLEQVRLASAVGFDSVQTQTGDTVTITTGAVRWQSQLRMGQDHPLDLSGLLDVAHGHATVVLGHSLAGMVPNVLQATEISASIPVHWDQASLQPTTAPATW